METKNSCSICLEESSGCHFGAEACRACAAFFRRSITQNKRYQCRGNNNCDITINIRCMCRACRFTKCVEMGMNPVGVKQTPENIRRRQASTSSDEMPLLTKMKANYEKMLNARMVVHKKDGQNLFDARAPRAINYKEAVEQGIKDVGLVADWISWLFEDFVNLAMDQKNILFRNFYTKFCQLEVTFMSHMNNSPNSIKLPSGDYIDVENLETFYFDPDAETQMSREEIYRLFQPTYTIQKTCLILPMISKKVDFLEFFSLCTLILWDTGSIGLTDECIIVGEKVKDDVIRELNFYMRNAKKIDEPCVRIASLVNLLPAVERCVRRFQDDMEMTQCFNIFKSSKEFYDLVNGNFC